jgi:hypothetical protein
VPHYPAAWGKLMTVNHADARATFEGKVRALEGLRIRAVDYWDVHDLGPEPARWDYGDWHHAVMGVQDRGACSCHRGTHGSPPRLRRRPGLVRGRDPQPPWMEAVFIPGDEIMVVFSAKRMTDMGYTDPRFVT